MKKNNSEKGEQVDLIVKHVEQKANEFFSSNKIGKATLCKNIIICGAGRSGKSTLARMIKMRLWGEGYNLVPLDPLRNVYDAICNEQTVHDWSSHISVLQKKWQNTFNTLITQTAQEGNKFNDFFIFNGWGVELDSLLKTINREDFIIIGIGYPRISPEEKLAQLIQYEIPEDWTSVLSYEEKKYVVDHLCKEEKYITAQIKKHKIPFFDTSFDRDKVLEEIMIYLEKNYITNYNARVEKIGFYEGKYYFLSNFSSFGIYHEGKLYKTVEHAYQAEKFKTTAPEVAEEIINALSADEAKKIAHSNEDKVVKNWDDIKLDVMEKYLRLKLEQNPYVKEQLFKTGEAFLYENSPVDYFWGVGKDNSGRNELGKLWMKLRADRKYF